MALSPLNTEPNNFPLNSSPYHSRVSSHAEEFKNYVMLAFNPGYALQAAELNEMQELFFLNQNLTQRMNSNWIRINNTQTQQFTAPFWEGLIPLDPTYVQISGVINTTTGPNFSYTISRGWYLYTDKISKLSFWIWNNTTYSGNVTVSSATPTYFGLVTELSYTNCCQTDDSCSGQDLTLRDMSQSFYQEFTCGASRVKATITPGVRSFPTSEPTNTPSFCSIFFVDVSPTNGAGIKYQNNYILANLP